MIRGVHTMFYTSDAVGLRMFLRDKVGLPARDVGDGWLIFDLPEADMGCHPTDHPGSPPSGTAYLSFYCDDLAATVAAMRAKGVVFTNEPHDVGYGTAIHFEMPGGFTCELYQPAYSKG